ncbi:carboxypeptidase [marine bacterium AO1-C]|nr:carboxypeptidase [marine bacterium AO1-C]
MSTYQKFTERMQKIADISHASALLQWDQEVYMPPKSARRRAQQLSTLAGMAHEMFTNDETGKLLESLAATNLSEIEKANVLNAKDEYEKNKKVPTEFVEKTSVAVSRAFQSWDKAKKAKDFSIFAPDLEALLELKLQECEYLGYEDHPYNAQLDIYEKNMTVAKLEVMFGQVKEQLFPFIEKIYKAPQVSDELMFQDYDRDKQWAYGIEFLQQMGYDMDAGRQDVSSHPFTTNFSATDVRVTTRINDQDLSEMLWSTIHEGGHALYEQGLKDDYYGLPTGSYLTLGIHESQSRLWENNVGRSLNFWQGNFGRLQEIFPKQLSKYTAEDFFKAMNKVQPSPIRTNADELTYHFHILIRYEIEKELFERKLQVKDLKEKWNAMYKKYLNWEVKDDAEGVLQDIHWSHGSFGYFPTYSIGSFYAAQFYHQAVQDVHGLETGIQAKDSSKLLQWLREKIHQHGKLYTADELCKRVTGEVLNFDYFMQYAVQKYATIYAL